MKNNSKNKLICILTALALWMAPGLEAQAEPGKKRTVTVEEIKQGAEDFLMSRLDWDSDSLDVAIDYDGKDLILPDGELAMDYGMPKNSRSIGRIPLTLQVKVDDRFIRRVRLNSQVAVYQDVVKVANPVNRGKVVESRDVSIERIRSERILKDVPSQLEEVVGQEATRNLRKGKILNLRDLKKAPLVVRGSRVLIVAKKGSMKITAPGTVREEGFKNSIVQVLNLATKKKVYGEVIDANTVEVKF
ncbi:hypothetical protein UR09_03405 [Candidatus Nitromaritima sp. SCGC AAA799-A02]|nr:hypothetical protein UZ36_06390 [Candidatus Nitromaritima sp. SCGC AAA799-C22]KMP11416.1 hypothetical protein UR09_03405 [Candidatus Nitromaritima sp. SCGC AAA799-A02]